MEQSHTRPYGVLIVFLILINAVMAWGQLNGTATAAASFHGEMITATQDTSARCSSFTRSEDPNKEGIHEQRASTDRVLMAEDMRCRQCQGKCKAENLKCRSQCAGESACLAHCEERSSKCETMCEQVFSCK